MKFALYILMVFAAAQVSFAALACEGKGSQAHAVPTSAVDVAKAQPDPLGERCMFDRECLPNERCITGMCVLPMSETQMSVAANMSVGRTCRSSAECSPGENCKNGVCQYANGPGMCISDIDCPIGEHCVDRQCRR